jgi:hypothetical protein
VKLDPKIVAELAIPFRPKAYLRVMPKVRAAVQKPTTVTAG